MKQLTLFSFRRCPYAIRARLALCQSQLPHVIEEIDLKSKPTHFLTLSPKATVPVLVVGDQTVLDESLDIVNWCIAQSHTSWPEDLPQADNLCYELHEKFIPALNRFKYPNRYTDIDTDTIQRQMQQFLDTIQHSLSSRTSSELMSKSELIVFPFIRQLHIADASWLAHHQYAVVEQWLDHYLSSTLFNRVMAQ
ncbi:MAG: glutathione S-transferase [Legionellales bacterium]|nr:glutathione S-transferase [Legionellales bacterium]